MHILDIEMLVKFWSEFVGVWRLWTWILHDILLVFVYQACPVEAVM